MGNRFDKAISDITRTPEYFKEGRAFVLAINYEGLEQQIGVYVQHPEHLEAQIAEKLYTSVPDAGEYTIVGEFDYRTFQRRTAIYRLARDAVFATQFEWRENGCAADYHNL